MKRQKRDRQARAHSKGYWAALKGYSSDACPFSDLNFREEWLGGWREARAAIQSGYFQ